MKRLAATVASAALMLGCGGVLHPVMTDPEIRFIVWGNQPAATFVNDWTALIAAGVMGPLAEYGVWSATVGPSIQAHPELPNGSVLDDAWVLGEVAKEAPRAPDGVMYVLVLPPGSTTPWMRDHGIRAEHIWAPTPLVITPPDEYLISHEIFETATDPGGLGVHTSFPPTGQNEIADKCEHQTKVLAGITVTKVWSIRDGACV